VSVCVILFSVSVILFLFLLRSVLDI
jgi:hypothetical protein